MRITIITSCSRPENLSLLFESIKFDFVEKWIIIYDTSKGNKYNWMYKNNPKILEAECPDEGVFGNAQKNFGLKFVKGGQVYFLDDDNIMHPNFWNIILSLKEDCVYMWDRLSYLYLSKDVYEVGSELINEIALNIKSDIGRIESGTCINDFGVYTGGFLVPYKYITTEFTPFLHYSSALFIKTIILENKENVYYIPHVLSYVKKL